MRKITNYCVVWAQGLQPLVTKVDEYISTGWQPFGQLVARGLDYHQVMVKYEEEGK